MIITQTSTMRFMVIPIILLRNRSTILSFHISLHSLRFLLNLYLPERKNPRKPA